MKTTKTAEKIKRHIQDYIRCYQENKRANPPELVLSNWQAEKLGLTNEKTLFGLNWRVFP